MASTDTSEQVGDLAANRGTVEFQCDRSGCSESDDSSDNFQLGTSGELFLDVRLQSEVLGRMFVGSSRKYYHDVAICINETVSKTLAFEVSKQHKQHARSGNFFFVSQHAEHVHIIHSCPYSNRSCRCGIWDAITTNHVLRRNPKNRCKCSQLSTEDWQNVLQYTISGGRVGCYYQVGDTHIGPCSRHKYIQPIGCAGNELPTLVESEANSSVDDIFKAESDTALHQPNKRGNDEESTSTKRSRNQIEEKIVQLMLQLLPIPLIDIVYTEEYLTSNLKYIRQRHPAVQDAADMVLAKINLMSIKELYNMSTSSQHNPGPRYHAVKTDRDEFYYSLEESVKIYKKLLIYQLGDYERVYMFCKQLFNVLDMVKPKRNTFVIIGEQSSGKNFFVDPIAASLVNVGFLGNPNKHNNFAYQDCVNRRIIIWNEPNYESSETDTLKMLLGGDTCPVRVKFRNDCVVHRTPIIIMSNEDLPLINDPVFQNRIYVHYWKTCPMLVEYTKKCHPLTFFEMCSIMNLSW